MILKNSMLHGAPTFAREHFAASYKDVENGRTRDSSSTSADGPNAQSQEFKACLIDIEKT